MAFYDSCRNLFLWRYLAYLAQIRMSCSILLKGYCNAEGHETRFLHFVIAWNHENESAIIRKISRFIDVYIIEDSLLDVAIMQKTLNSFLLETTGDSCTIFCQLLFNTSEEYTCKSLSIRQFSFLSTNE